MHGMEIHLKRLKQLNMFARVAQHKEILRIDELTTRIIAIVLVW